MQVVWNVLIRSINVTGKNQQQIQSAISKLVSRSLHSYSTSLWHLIDVSSGLSCAAHEQADHTSSKTSFCICR